VIFLRRSAVGCAIRRAASIAFVARRVARVSLCRFVGRCDVFVLAAAGDFFDFFCLTARRVFDTTRSHPHFDSRHVDMGISRGSWHKRLKTGGRQPKPHVKRKFELGRPAAMTRIGATRVHQVRTRGGNVKMRALRLETGNFSWPTLGAYTSMSSFRAAACRLSRRRRVSTMRREKNRNSTCVVRRRRLISLLFVSLSFD
jgi:ribosomal protein eS8